MSEFYFAANTLNQRAEKILKLAAEMHKSQELASTVNRQLRKALKLIDTAIRLLVDRKYIEPARSQLYFNAAKLCWGLGEMERAEEYIRHGLGGDAPPENVNNLLTLRMQIHNVRKAIKVAEKEALHVSPGHRQTARPF